MHQLFRAPCVRRRPCRAFSTTRKMRGYGETVTKLKIGSHTRVMFQGFTGKQATVDAKDSIKWGTQIVGGVTPGRSGEHLGLPVLPTVRQAIDSLKPDATAIYVAARHAAAAIEEAIEAEIPLVVAVAEHVPLHDLLRIHSILRTQSKSRLVGPNSPGIISAVGRCRIGFQPLSCFTPGRVAVVAKSGTLSYETVASTTRAGLGQSLCIGVGGDILPGTGFCEALSILETDPDTDAIALIGEIGGTAEMEAAAWIRDYHSRTASPKPIVGLVAGINEVPGRVMGHAGAFTALEEPDAIAKITALANAGVIMVDHPSEIGNVLKSQLRGTTFNHQDSASRIGSSVLLNGQQRRHMSTIAKTRTRRSFLLCSKPQKPDQRRSLYLSGDKAMAIIRETGQATLNTGPPSSPGSQSLLGIGIDRSARMPCIIASPSTGSDALISLKRFPFDFVRGPNEMPIEQIAAHLNLNTPSLITSLRQTIRSLSSIFYRNEAYLLITHVAAEIEASSSCSSLTITSANLHFDDAAFRIAGRHAELHALGNNTAAAADQDGLEIEAENSGIVYIRLLGDACEKTKTKTGYIGTIVNGAGLAMNTVDALALLGGRAANFLDTGGKATTETVKRSFALVLRDPRVRAVFVNIFGGLTLGDMIARGVIMALKEVGTAVPVVVRIRGTNEKEGQELIANSGLPVYAFDSFDEAAAKVIELSKR